MLPLFIHPLQRNGYFLMEVQTWNDYRSGKNDEGIDPNKAKYNFLLALAALNVQEEMIDGQILLTIKDFKNERNSNYAKSEIITDALISGMATTNN